MSLPNDEQVRFDILIEAQATLKSLREILRLTEDNKDKIIQFSQVVQAQSRAWGVSWQQALNVYKQLNAELSKQKKGNLFGNVGGQDLFGQTEKYMGALDQAGRLAEDVGRKSKKAGEDSANGWQKAISTVNILRIALGALISMILFHAIQAFTSFFSEASKQARQLEDTLYRLANVERDLSFEGIEISLKGLEDGIDRIRKKMPIFSREDISQLVGTIAISTKQLGLTEQQILDLAQAVAVLNIRSEKQEDLSTTAQHVLSSVLTGNAKGITALGIAFTDNVMRAKAMELGFLEAGEAVSELSENEKGITKLNIILESTGGELDAVNDYLDTNTAKIQANTAAWKDFQTLIGQLINNAIPNIVPALEKVQKAVELTQISKLFGKQRGESGEGFAWMDATIWAKLGTGIKLTTKEYERLKSVLAELSDEEILQIFPDPSAIKDRFTRELVQSLVTIQDTATDTQKLLELNPTVDMEELNKLEEKLQDIATDLEQGREDLEKKFGQKQEDIDLEYIRKQADAERDLARKLEDINRDAERDIANLKEKQREDDLRAEEDYQNKLWELRMRYLLNLEDALHARDARQVIRLQREYEIDKEALERKKGLDDKQREEDQSNALEDIEIRRQQRIEDAQQEFQEKLADQRLAKQRELDDLNVWYAREEADLQQSIERRLQAVVDGWIREHGATQEGANAIYGLLMKYFGPGGLTDSIAGYMFQQLGQAALQLAQIGSLNYGLGLSQSTNPFQGQYKTPTVPYRYSASSPTRFAEGGTLLATRPTTVTFGEAGAEMATFTPLGRLGRNQGKVFGGSGGEGMNGQIVLDILLSPDLEARIIENSMDGVGEIIARVNRSKV